MAEGAEKYHIPLFDGSNFDNWKFRMETLLNELDLLSFVEQKYTEKVVFVAKDTAEEREEKQKKLDELRKKDKKCCSQIIQRVTDSHLEYVKDKDSAFDIWSSLSNTFQRRILRIVNLETRRINSTVKLPTRATQRAAVTTDIIFTNPRVESYVHAEWDVDPNRPSSGMAAEVVVRVQEPDQARGPAPPYGVTPLVNGTSTGAPPYPVEESPVEVIVRAEEILLVVLVLVIWVAAIALFFNRWGKIRMLEPYQPKFQQQHRASCPIGDSVLSPQVSVKSERLVQRMKHQRMSFSKYNVNFMGDNAMYTSLPSPNPLRRQRQNSVFVGSSTMAVMNPPRRVKSAIDIQHMVLSDYSPGSLSGCSSLLPMLSSFSSKRPSITIEKPPPTRYRRQSSILLDQPTISHHHHPSKNYHRRPSCLVDRPHFGRHRHFISFDQPTTSWDRRTSITIERPSRRHQTLSFEHTNSMDQPSLIIEPPSTSQEQPPTAIVEEEVSGRSCPESMVCLHQPPSAPAIRSPSRHRLSTSLDNPAIRMERRVSEARNLRSPISTSFDETQIKLSNLEYSKVSDV